MTDDNDGATMGNIIRIDEGRIKHRLGEMVGGRVDEGLNAMLDAEADRLCGGSRYERGEDRRDTRAGNDERSRHTKAGDVQRRRKICILRSTLAARTSRNSPSFQPLRRVSSREIGRRLFSLASFPGTGEKSRNGMEKFVIDS